MNNSLHEVPTPALVLDRNVLAANLSRVAERMTRLGVNLRPHVKTAKSVDVARLAVQGHSGGITVSTLREAAYFIDHGFRDLTYAITITPDKLAQVAELQKKGARLSILTDDVGVARAIASSAQQLSANFNVFIEIDAGYHRSGVLPDSASLLAIGKSLTEAPRTALAGILTHAGHSYLGESPEEIARVAEQERAEMVRAAENLRAAGLPCPIVSVGSTPTALTASHLEGVNEARPGNYMFFDLTMVGLGVCRLEDIAAFVVTTVISHKRDYEHALVDAGALALSKDLSAHLGPMPGVGYGLVCDLQTRRPLDGLRVAEVSQEQGWLRATAGSVPFEKIPVGSRLAVLPNHSCLTSAAFDQYYVVDGGVGIADIWERINGW